MTLSLAKLSIYSRIVVCEPQHTLVRVVQGCFLISVRLLRVLRHLPRFPVVFFCHENVHRDAPDLGVLEELKIPEA